MRPGLPIHTWRSAVLRITDRREAELVTAELGRVLPSERHLTRICERADASGTEPAGDPLFDLDTGTPTFHVPDPAELLGAADGRLFVRRGDRVLGHDVRTGAGEPVDENEIPDSARRPRQDPFAGVARRADQVIGVTYHLDPYTAWDTHTMVTACEDDTEVLRRVDLDGFDSRGPKEVVPLPGRVLVLSGRGGIICLTA